MLPPTHPRVTQHINPALYRLLMRNRGVNQHVDLQDVVQGSHGVVTHDIVTLCMSVKTLSYALPIAQRARRRCPLQATRFSAQGMELRRVRLGWCDAGRDRVFRAQLAPLGHVELRIGRGFSARLFRIQAKAGAFACKRTESVCWFVVFVRSSRL